MATAAQTAGLETGRRIFSRILVGVSASARALEAARQAALLRDVDGRLTLLAAWDIGPVLGGTGSEVPYYYDEAVQRGAAERALAAAQAHVEARPAITARLVRGTPAQKLLEAIADDEDTLVAVGASRLGRLLGIVEGSVTSQMIHRAPCSVLVARPQRNGSFRRIAVGVDGSACSAAAYAAARRLADRFDADLRVVVAHGGKGFDEPRVLEIVESGHEDSLLPPVAALTRAAETADLIVTGSRGLHGLHALGSVSERVAYGAACSALVVREVGA